jgi:hypothetical protein
VQDVPRRIGPYVVKRELGRGGHRSSVYFGRDPELGRAVAIKVLPEALVSDPERLPAPPRSGGEDRGGPGAASSGGGAGRSGSAGQRSRDRRRCRRASRLPLSGRAGPPRRDPGWTAFRRRRRRGPEGETVTGMWCRAGSRSSAGDDRYGWPTSASRPRLGEGGIGGGRADDTRLGRASGHLTDGRRPTPGSGRFPSRSLRRWSARFVAVTRWTIGKSSAGARPGRDPTPSAVHRMSPTSRWSSSGSSGPTPPSPSRCPGRWGIGPPRRQVTRSTRLGALAARGRGGAEGKGHQARVAPGGDLASFVGGGVPRGSRH